MADSIAPLQSILLRGALWNPDLDSSPDLSRTGRHGNHITNDFSAQSDFIS
jgi:hypothetical protein